VSFTWYQSKQEAERDRTGESTAGLKLNRVTRNKEGPSPL